ncbi:MAG TPA: hypothetical protein VE999_10015 [Gemmataceae bacterium]|nr:hypothetical protein [Gemmataceae bacterium]
MTELISDFGPFLACIEHLDESPCLRRSRSRIGLRLDAGDRSARAEFNGEGQSKILGPSMIKGCHMPQSSQLGTA